MADKIRNDDGWIQSEDVNGELTTECHCGKFVLTESEHWYEVDCGGYIHEPLHCGSREDGCS